MKRKRPKPAGKTLEGEGVAFVCPFCKKNCVALEAGAVLHAMPMCPEYRRMEPDRFLHAVNVANGAHN